jgi:hypothetical protein
VVSSSATLHTRRSESSCRSVLCTSPATDARATDSVSGKSEMAMSSSSSHATPGSSTMRERMSSRSEGKG